jgi:large subunit ribosomal protein L15
VYQHQLQPPHGARRPSKRVGRGNASGHGTYSGRGLKGQKARAGGGVRASFEGGQLPLVRRMGRKRGFTNIFRVEYQTVNLSRLTRFAVGSEVTLETLLSAGIIKDQRKPVKVLGDGALKGPLTIRAHKFSAVARQKIEAAGGKVEELADGSQ